YGCVAFGMPMIAYAFYPQEYLITPETTYILVNHQDHIRRIFTDGRDWRKEMEPTFAGYSIGKWIDEDGDGRYDVLEVETRGPFPAPGCLRCVGPAAALRHPVGVKGAHPSRQGRSHHPARRDPRPRSCAAPPLDRGQALSPQSRAEAGLAGIRLRGRQPARSR